MTNTPMNKVTVNLDNPTYYEEPNSVLYRFKRKLTYRNLFVRLQKYLKNSSDFSMLEIGTGSGFFISLVESKYPKATLTGLEFDPRLVDITTNKVKNAKILQGNAEEFELGVKYDLIVSSQVIEHLYDPERMFEHVIKHLKQGGIFLFTTPNSDCVAAKIMKDKWHGFRDDHVSLKNCKEWVSLAEKNGFTTIYSGSTFFSGIPVLNKFPLGVFNWILLLIFGSMRWRYGESFVGIFRYSNDS